MKMESNHVFSFFYSVLFVRPIHMDTCSCSLFILVAIYYFMVWSTMIYLSFLLCGHMDCFQFWNIPLFCHEYSCTCILVNTCRACTERRNAWVTGPLNVLWMAVIKKSTKNKCWRGWRRGNPPTLLVGREIGKPLWRTVWRFLKKLELPYDPAIPPTPGHTSRQNYNSKRYMHPNVHSNTIHNSQDMEAT